MDDLQTRLYLRNYTNRARVENELDQLLEELFTLEFQNTMEMSKEELEVRQRKVEYITKKIERQQELLLNMPAPVEHIAKPKVEEKPFPVWTAFWFCSTLVIAFLYNGKLNQIKEIEE